jgi:predicted nuclease with TOPRIM domain
VESLTEKVEEEEEDNRVLRMELRRKRSAVDTMRSELDTVRSELRLVSFSWE